jgi:hypothetical protein
MSDTHDGFHLTYEHPVAIKPAEGRPDITVTIRVIWPQGATAKEVGMALTTATAHALDQYGKRVGA